MGALELENKTFEGEQLESLFKLLQDKRTRFTVEFKCGECINKVSNAAFAIPTFNFLIVSPDEDCLLSLIVTCKDKVIEKAELKTIAIPIKRICSIQIDETYPPSLLKICALEVITINVTAQKEVASSHIAHTPVGPGANCNVCCYNAAFNPNTTPPTLGFSFDAQLEYQYEDQPGCTFLDFCDIVGNSACLSLPDGLTICPCGSPLPVCSATCISESITTTPTTVSGIVSFSIAVANLCAPTVICIQTCQCQ